MIWHKILQLRDGLKEHAELIKKFIILRMLLWMLLKAQNWIHTWHASSKSLFDQSMGLGILTKIAIHKFSIDLILKSFFF